MKNYELITMEGVNYRITVHVNGVEEISDYQFYGSLAPVPSKGIHHHLIVDEVNGHDVILLIPPMARGIYQYQLFAKRISTNQEFLLLGGRLEVQNRICDEITNIPIHQSSTSLDVAISGDEYHVDATIHEGVNGKDGKDGAQGEKGDKGDKGEAFTFADFTSEQLAALKGEKGDKGDKGDPGEGGGASIDWVQTDEFGNILIGSNITEKTNNSTLIGHSITCQNGQWRNFTESSVVIGNYATNQGAHCVNIDGHTYDSGAVAIGGDANFRSVSIGLYSWGAIESVSIGYDASGDSYGVSIGTAASCASYGLAIGNYAYADYGNITLKSGNVEVKFSAEGMTLNGEPYGGGGGSDYAQQMLYKVKYAHADLNEVRNSQSSEWKDYYDEYGNSQGYYHYPYYDDISPDGGWYYDLMTRGYCNDYTSGTNIYNTQFDNCPLLKKIVAKIGRNGTYITNEFFYECRNLEEVIIQVDILMEATKMFSYCPKLHIFYADLSCLESASYMFGTDSYNCTSLNVESVEHIANSISYYSGEIYIGMARELQNDNGDGKYQRCQDALNRIRNKGWTVYEIYSENY